MHKNDILQSQTSYLPGVSLTPPDIIVRGGQDAVSAYARLHIIFSNARNDQFAVGLADFLDWLDDLAPGMALEHIVEDNIATHLSSLADIGCSESEQSARLCAIDLFLSSFTEVGLVGTSLSKNDIIWNK